MDMEELHEFANILTQKEEEYNTTIEQAANAFTQMDEEFENKIEQAANTFTQMDEEFENKIEQAANALTEKELLKQSEMEYLEAKASGDVRSETAYGNLTIIELAKSRFGIKCDAEFIVPFGKYEWIEGFDHGLSRVRTHGLTGYTKNITAIFDDDWNEITDRKIIEEKEAEYRMKHPEKYAKWGIIDETGKEVLPTEYDEIWKFYGKNRLSTKVVKDGVEDEIYFHNLNSSIPMPANTKKRSSYFDENDCDNNCFNINDCYDYEGNFDYDRLEDAILDGEYVSEDW